MRLIAEPALAHRLSESDPIPPEDRVPLGSGHALEIICRRQAPKLLCYFARRTVGDAAKDLQFTFAGGC